ncbi:transglycosylase SLT domain-containing protein [Bdellovibrionota bacterium FG-1]
MERLIVDSGKWASLGAIFGVFALVLSGCATVRTSSPSGTLTGPLSSQSEPRPEPKTLGEVLQPDSSRPVSVETPEIVIQGVKLKNTKFDIPITINSRVEYWVDYFTGRGRKHFERYLERSEFFIPYIAPLLKQNGMPEDLVYLAMIESGFNNFARSRAKAVGPWQFISATGKRYGLMVNWWVDERRDIRKSTLAAVGYLHDLYVMMGSWELAAASYNAGETKVARAVQRFGSKDFWVISKQRFLRPETRDYVPKIIAAALLAKNRTQFGFAAGNLKPGAGEAVAGDGEVVHVVKTDQPLEDTQNIHNPNVIEAANAAGDDEWEDGDESPTEVAQGMTPATLTSALVETVLAKPIPTPHVNKDGQVGGESIAEFEVQSPADMLKIARAAGISYLTVKALNPELLRWCTPPNVSTYRVKLPSSVREHFLQAYNHEAFPRQITFMTYKVRRGETLARIASQYGIKVDPIADLNGVSPRMRLKRGVQVLLPIPNDRSRSLASLDVRDPPEAKRHRRSHRRKYSRITYKKRQSARTHGRVTVGET